MIDSSAQLIRSDRVGLYSLNGAYEKLVSLIPLPLLSARYGDLSLRQDGTVTYEKVKSYDENWSTHIRGMSAEPVSLGQALHCYQGVSPKRLLAMTVDDRRYLVLFTGVTHFISGGEKLIAHIPGVHHAGALAVGTKSAFQNRGGGKRAVEARNAWLSVLSGAAAPDQLPLLADALA
jgi:hypothetical protein